MGDKHETVILPGDSRAHFHNITMFELTVGKIKLALEADGKQHLQKFRTKGEDSNFKGLQNFLRCGERSRGFMVGRMT